MKKRIWMFIEDVCWVLIHHLNNIAEYANGRWAEPLSSLPDLPEGRTLRIDADAWLEYAAVSDKKELTAPIASQWFNSWDETLRKAGEDK
jgi:hypothetical protein